MDTSFLLRTNAIAILEDEFLASERSVDFAEWVVQKTETDASFYSWLFPNAENISDFGSGMSMNQIKTADRLIRDIEILQDTRDNY
jgi:hypothetical protein